MMNKPVYDGAGHLFIKEYSIPMAEFQIGRNYYTALFIAF